MALVDTQKMAAQAAGFTALPVVRQAGLLVGLAASIALGIGIFYWAQEPAKSVLFGNLSGAETAEVVEILQKEGIQFDLDERTGSIMVPRRDLHQIRLTLASAGLPRSTGPGFEWLEKDQKFGTSEFIETARFQRALEGELARSIATLSSVDHARVHIAMPKPSVFVRKKEKPSASVLIHLFRGRSLDKEQVGAILHLVASSVPRLEPEQVTVVDQTGRLLSDREGLDGIDTSLAQFEYTQAIERDYAERVENLLGPVVGRERVKAQVAVQMDFRVMELSEEIFDPDPEAKRSEQLIERRNEADEIAQGVPGALTNQPPGSGTTNPDAAVDGLENGQARGRISSNVTRNYELDRSVRHTRFPTGTIQRLSVAVVVDDLVGVNEEGEPTREPLSQEALSNLTMLVKQAVGFDEKRGDKVHIMNTSFQPPAASERTPELEIWEQPWVWDLGKQLLGVLGVLLLLLLVLRPVMRDLAWKGEQLKNEALPEPEEAEEQPALEEGGSGEWGDEEEGGEPEVLANDTSQLSQQQLENYNEKVAAVKEAVIGSPAKAARVLNGWVTEDAE